MTSNSGKILIVGTHVKSTKESNYRFDLRGDEKPNSDREV